MKWDDYKLVLAIARETRLPAAAKALNLTTSTVFRRLDSIELTLKEPIFNRKDGAYEPNNLGHKLTQAAERMEQEVQWTERAIENNSQLLRGRMTITASEALAPFFLARHLPMLTEKHPGLKFDIIAANALVSLASREADIALRPIRPTDESLFGRKLANIRWAIYGSDMQETTDGNQKMIGFSGNQYAEKAMKSQKNQFPDAQIQTKSNSLLLTAALAANGVGQAVVPMVLGEQWPGLRRLSDPHDHEFGELWIVCHQDMRNNARIRVVFDALIEAAKMDRVLLSGEGSS